MVNAIPRELLMNRSSLFEAILGRIVPGIAAIACVAAIALAAQPAQAAYSGDPLASAPISAEKPALVKVAQACPPGYNYDWKRKRCRSAHDRDYDAPRYRGNSYGGACPPGYNWGPGGCYPASNYYTPPARYYGGPGCPPGYNWNGYGCVRNY
jgi:hypothetical protein